MTTSYRGIGKFTAQNIVAVLRAVPESDGTYADVARIAQDYDGDVHSRTIANWMQAGNADIRNGKNATAYARFTKLYKDRLKEQGGREANRARELDRALEILERTCECGNPKMLMADGSLADRCQVCRELDAAPRRGRHRTVPIPVG